MKKEFLQPRFDGKRFADHTIPLEVGRDLAAYETLVIELAKHLYMQSNPLRQRLPKGFGSNFHLHLEQIRDGSAIPALVTFQPDTPNTSLFPVGVEYTLYDQARDLISDCVAAAPGQIPSKFPPYLLSHFNTFGRSLRADESIQLRRGAVLTPDKRKELVLAASNVYQREVELIGRIGEADWEKSSFRLRISDTTYFVVPMTEDFHAKARKYGGRERFTVTFKGVVTFDRLEKMQKVVSTEVLDVQPDNEIASRFTRLFDLKDGWFEGGGLAPSSEQVSATIAKFEEFYPDKLPLPDVFPTQDGNLLFEWRVEGQPSLDLDLGTGEAQFHAFAVGGGDIEGEFFLTTDQSWVEFSTFLNEAMESLIDG